MRHLFFVLSLLPVFAFAASYTYNFEQAAIPTDFSVDKGTLSLATNHYKEGSQSLCWQVSGTAVMTVKGFTSVSASSSKAWIMQLYFPQVTMDTLVVEMLNGTAVKRTATILCNYKGWRQINRLYNEYASTAAFTMDAMRFTLHPASGGSRCIYMDAIELSGAVDDSRVPGCMWALDYTKLKVNTAPIKYYIHQPDIPVSTPTAKEIADLKTIRDRLRPTVSYNPVQASTARQWVENNMNITRNSDGSVYGTLIDNTAAGLETAILQPMLERLVHMAGAKLKGDTITGKVFDMYLDHLLDQGFADGCNIVYTSNSYTDPRTVIGLLIKIIPACNDEQLTEVVKLGKWLSQYYTMYYPESTWQTSIVSDILYVFVPYIKVFAAYHPMAAEAIRELKGLQRYFDRNTTYTDGGYDMLKVDGTGFHHNTHYNNYMYAYEGLMDAIYDLRQTSFEISEDGYQRFGKAIESIYLMATPSVGDARHYALTLSGRNPFGSGQTVFWGQSYWKKLIESGVSYPSVQSHLQSVYNYFYQTKTYDVPTISLDGFHAFNWSPIGVYRHGKWVATMHAPTMNFWSAEIYAGSNKGNRFGVYQGHGALEITYQGGSLAASGYPTNQTGGGWDWNVMPGATVVRFNSWQEMTPGKNTSQRFDQYTASKNFSGAAGLGNYGVWACDFDAVYKWGSTQCFVSTDLIFHKSVFVCDTMLIALGSGVDSYGSYSEDRMTTTNLFQTIVGQFDKAGYADGKELVQGTDSTLQTGQPHWLLSSKGTGYYLPKNNDPVYVFYNNQKSPKLTGEDVTNPTTTLKAAKAYINHGSMPENKSYEFVVIPGQTAASMQQLATQFNDTLPYKVLSCTNNLHALQYQNVTSYVFYGTINDVNKGIVRSTSNQHLMVDSLNTLTGVHTIVLCNPNLIPINRKSTEVWNASPSQTNLVLNGNFSLQEPVGGVSLTNIGEHTTKLDITFDKGLPLVVHLKDNNFDPSQLTYPTEDCALQAYKILVDGQIVIVKNNQYFTLVGSPYKK